MSLYIPNRGDDDLRALLKEDETLRYRLCDQERSRLSRSLWRVRGIVSDLQDEGVDIYHGLSGELPFGIGKSAVKSVVTIHDLIFLRHPEYYKWIDRQIYEYKFRKTVESADRIIAISECTKRDIMFFSGVGEDKIEVIYQDCNQLFRQPVADSLVAEAKDKYHLPDKFMLCVGTIEERKNALLAVRAMKQLPSDLHLVLIGRPTDYAVTVQREAERLGVSSRVMILSGVPTDSLPAIYHQAGVFVYPSRYEGFGIPIIEAIYSGLPVVAAKGSCLEEAGGDACLYVSPDSVDDFASAVDSLISESDADRTERVNRSRRYVERFDGGNAAGKVVALYRSLLEG